MARMIMPRNLRSRQRAFKAFEMRLRGMSVSAIADQLEVSPPHVSKLIRKQIAEMKQDVASEVQEQKEIELQRTDWLVRQTDQIINAKCPACAGVKFTLPTDDDRTDDVRKKMIRQRLDGIEIIPCDYCSGSGRPHSPDTHLRAVTTMLHIQDRRARWMGFDKPNSSDIASPIGQEDANLLAELSGMSPEQLEELLLLWSTAPVEDDMSDVIDVEVIEIETGDVDDRDDFPGEVH